MARPHDDLVTIRRDLHAHPELGYEEDRTSRIIAEFLAQYGIEVTTGIAKTGVVGALKKGASERAIGLRADMDALPMDELNSFAHRSQSPGKFHGCGHDGHTAMLLGAARVLAEQVEFDGTVYLIFQPAEEGGGGGKRMVEEGLFERFPMTAVYGLHNGPAGTLGNFSGKEGAFMAALTEFDVLFTGRGGHSAMPQTTVDPLPAIASFILGAQTVVSRMVEPQASAVLSITKMAAGTAYNVIPDTASVGGSCRYHDEEVGRTIRERMARLAEQTAAAFGCKADVTFRELYPVLVNSSRETRLALDVARKLRGEEAVNGERGLVMGSEDFAFMLQAKPGAYLFLETGTAQNGAFIHNPHYDFNDDAIPFGIDYWVEIVKTELGG